MQNPNMKPERTPFNMNNISTIFGGLFLTIGIFLSVWVFSLIYSLLNTDFKDFKLLDRLVPESKEAGTIVVRFGEEVVDSYEFPEIFFMFFALSLVMILLGISITLLRAILTIGIQLLHADIHAQYEKIKKNLDKLTKLVKRAQ